MGTMGGDTAGQCLARPSPWGWGLALRPWTPLRVGASVVRGDTWGCSLGSRSAPTCLSSPRDEERAPETLISHRPRGSSGAPKGDWGALDQGNEDAGARARLEPDPLALLPWASPAELGPGRVESASSSSRSQPLLSQPLLPAVVARPRRVAGPLFGTSAGPEALPGGGSPGALSEHLSTPPPAPWEWPGSEEPSQGLAA